MGGPQPFDRLAYAGDGPQFLAKARIEPGPHPLEKSLVGRKPVFFMQDGRHGLEAAAKEALARLLRRHRNAGGRQRFHKNLKRNRLAVHQHAITIENHQLRGAPRHRHSPSFPSR